MPQEAKNKSSRTRERLSKLLREGGELLTVEHAAHILDMSNDDAAKTMGRWRNQGWLSHQRGVYVAVPVEASSAGSAGGCMDTDSQTFWLRICWGLVGGGTLGFDRADI